MWSFDFLHSSLISPSSTSKISIFSDDFSVDCCSCSRFPCFSVSVSKTYVKFYVFMRLQKIYLHLVLVFCLQLPPSQTETLHSNDWNRRHSTPLWKTSTLCLDCMELAWCQFASPKRNVYGMTEWNHLKLNTKSHHRKPQVSVQSDEKS